MFYLFTGQPGSQKTANMINFVLSDPQFKNRPVYFYNINSCVVPNWTEITEDQLKDWPNFLPEGAVLLIDEAQEIWRPAAWDKTPPIHVTGLERHRQRGFDIIATTQHPMLIHTAVRRQVQQHRHYTKNYGLRSKALSWEKCVNDPDDHFAKKEAESLSGSVPKETYSYYQSTVLNTHKKRIPKKLIYVALGFVVVVAGLTNFALDLLNRPDQIREQSGIVESVTDAIKPAAPTSSEFKFPRDPDEYMKLFKPRIDGLAHTAPIYDELQKPVVSPRTFCVRVHRSDADTCNCYSQQATHLNVGLAMCNKLIDQGLFDHTLKIETASYNSRGEATSQIHTESSAEKPRFNVGVVPAQGVY